MKYVIKKEKSVSGKTIDYQKDLNEEQYRVVTEAEGASLVLAGAGSGKTRTLIYRVAYLLGKGIAPENILLVTFTNKAARNMQDRIEMLLESKPKGLWSGTFHHIGNRSIRLFTKELGFRANFGILDEEDALSLIKVCMSSLNKPVKKDEYFPKPKIIRSLISFSINTGIALEATIAKRYPYFFPYAETIKKIRDEYDEKKKNSNTMDYDDLLTNWLAILRNSSSAREKFTQQFRYILVDEYQDTNMLQAEIIKELASRHGNVLVVGDDAQAIYSFRGADVSNILRFPDDYPDAKIFKLETNYRSAPEILELANDSISKNKHQYEKHLKAKNESFQKPALVEVKDLYEQADFVAQRILELRDEGTPLGKIAVLFRAHYQAAELEMELTKRGIPFVVRGGVRFFEQAHIKDVLAHVKILLNPFDEISWMRALSIQPGIGSIYAGKIFDEFAKAGSLEKVMAKGFGRFLPERAQKGLAKFKKIIKPLLREGIKKRPDEAIRAVVEAGYDSYVMTHFDNASDRVEDLRELINFAHTYKSVSGLLHDITLRESFRGETIREAPSHEEHLVLSTIHQAKGLEWGAVFIVGLCEGRFPHPKAAQELVEMEEERRLFYVAATRTERELYLIHPITRYDYKMGTVISRKSIFIEELDENLYDRWDIEEDSEKVIDLDEQ
ncbi:MAG: ATP-dependent helicase [Candidatus Omnitrophica bacterium]|nr:ATP-dependent helicase [Candidatus Omnitrophota bacterium]